LLRDSCRSFDITGNPLKFITVDITASPSSPEATFMKLVKFRQELNIASFKVYHELKVTAI
jgi:hypothetical protein